MAKEDRRIIAEAEMEEKIQSLALKKDSKFKLEGPWKKFRGKRSGQKVYAVDFAWVYSNLSVLFHHGGHGYVHEFIPLDEIWVSYNHHSSCKCKKIRKDNLVSERYFESSLRHELMELALMKRGLDYWAAHNQTLDKEREWGLLEDPYTENYQPLK
ncbi:hypothetical protein J4479_01050 [Candidatus Woesearchaeota archaeon]|nr:hypothetical protein [Candidatus Woesearchaeota archaeon]